ncbi:hypothetical protein ACFWY9_11555 [Amycolatopsis sp. NPDC059027]|uniref:hypothetical protein n=1 Tax=Amycolatopsis sp. NPDC059027 TaxID=3346709 RepID=UPI003672CB82
MPEGWKKQPRDSKGRWTKKGTAITAAAAVGIVVAGTASGLGGGGASTSAVQGARAGSQGRASGKEAARKGQRDAAWQRMGLKVVRKAAETELRCATRSFGQAQQFFLRTPCRKLDRLLLALGDGQGNSVVVSIAWVRMASAKDASRFKNLVDTQGTGNITPLGGAALGLAEIHFTGRYYDSHQKGALVVNAEATPIGGHPGEQLLHDIADVADEFPPP